MRLVGKENLVEFYIRHTDAKVAIEAWVAEVEKATWKSPLEVKLRYPKASVIQGNRFVFDIKGNKYRIDTVVAFNTAIVVVKRVGTHREYDNWKF